MSKSESGLDAGDIENKSVQHTPVILILDTSHSMSEATTTPDGTQQPKIEQVNEGLEFFHDELLAKDATKARVDVAVVTFGGTAEVHQKMTHITDWTPSTLDSGGNTPMGDAINKAIDVAEGAKNGYRENATPYTRPLMWLLTDGKPTDMDPGDPLWEDVTNQIEVGEKENHLMFFAMGVGGADMDVLNQLVEDTPRPALELKEGMFEEYFKFVKNSVEQVSEDEDMPDEVGDSDELEDFVKKH